MDEELKLAIRAYDEFTSIMTQFTGALASVQKGEQSVEQATDALNKASATMADRMTKSRDALEKTRAKLEEKAKADDAAAEASKKHERAVDSLLQGLGALGILQTVKRGLEEVTTAGAGFVQQMDILRGLTGESTSATEQWLMELQGQRKGVTELGEGLNELARAGYNAAQSQGALLPLADFSTAAMQRLEQAMGGPVTIMKTWQLDVSKAAEVADTLTMAANKSALGFDDFQLALGMSSGVARLAGQDYHELVAELSVLRDAGLGASDAGTSIKSAWMALMNPSVEATRVMKDLGIQVYDAQGRMKSWADIVAGVEKALAPLNEQSRNLALTTLFGSDGVRAMALSMQKGSQYIRGLTEDLRNSQGATTELAAEMGANFPGAVQRAQVNLEKFKVTVFSDLQGALAGFLDVIDSIVMGFNSMPPAVRGVIELFIGSMGLIGVIGAVATLARSTLIPTLSGLITVLDGVAVSAGFAEGALAALAGPVGWIIAILGGLIGGFALFSGAAEKAAQSADAQAKSLVELSHRYDEVSKAASDSAKSEEERHTAAEQQKEVIKQVGDLFPELVKRWDEHGQAVELDTERLKRNTDETEKNLKSKAKGELDKAVTKAAGLRDHLSAAQADLEPELAIAKASMQDTLSPAALEQFVADQRTMRETAIAQLQRDIEKADAEVARLAAMSPDVEGRSSAGHRQAGGAKGAPSSGTGTYTPPKGGEKDPEKERLSAIRDQMDELRHLVVMDDQRVDTAQEQLAWLQKIRATLGSSREIEEAIHGLETDISRAPLQEQLAAFENRKKLGLETASSEAAFYRSILANGEQLHLSQQDAWDFTLAALNAEKKAEGDKANQARENLRYETELYQLSADEQIRRLREIHQLYRAGSDEQKQIILEIAKLERQASDEKKERQQKNQETLLGLLREGYEAERRVEERKLRDRQAEDEKKLRNDRQTVENDYKNRLGALQGELAVLEAQNQAIEAQNRLLDIQNAIREKDKEIADVRGRRNRIVVEQDPTALFGIRIRRTYDETKEGQLLKEKAKLEKNLADEQRKQEFDRRRESLQAQMKALEEERTTKLAAFDQQLQDLREAQGKEKDQLATYWDTRLADGALKAELEKTGWQTHYDTLLTQTKTWVTDMNKAWADLQRPALDSGAALSKALGGSTSLPPTTRGASGSAGGAGSSTTSVEVNNYGPNHYNGVEGVKQGAAAMVSAFHAVLKPN